MIKTKSFASVLKKYKAVFLDSYGVLKNQSGMIPGAQETIDFIRAQGMGFCVLTNDASRGQELQARKFQDIGLKGIEAHEIITSGMMAKQFLENKIRRGRVAYLGTEAAAQYIIRANLEAIPVAEVDFDNADDIKAMVFLDDEGYDWKIAINKTVNLLRRKNIPGIVANSDKIYPVANNDVSIATGGIAQLVESILGREFIHFGKPDSQMFMFATEQLQEKMNLTRKDILMVGDTLHTDILGGNKFGISTALVLTGNTRAENVRTLVKAKGVVPDFICDSIAL